VHGENDSVLARYLGADQPFYGLAQHFTGKKIRFTRIEDIANHYIEEMQTVQARGPFFLGGYAIGALIALEMAEQLRQRQQEVALLALIGAAGPRTIDGAAAWSSDDARLYGRRFGAIRHPRRLWETASAALLDCVNALTCHAYLFSGRVLPAELHNFYIDKIVHRKLYGPAVRRYEPKPYRGRITIFEPEDVSDQPWPWERLAQGGIDVHRIPGDRPQLMAEPNVSLLAARLKACLDKARDSGLSPGSTLCSKTEDYP
jgi:thioesterase domain-containing protein